jgi:hypothetical protein
MTKTDEPTGKQGLAFEELGKAFYEQTPAPTDPAELLTPIRTLYSRLAEIDASLVTHKSELTGHGKGIPPVVVGVAMAIMPPLGFFLLWNHPTLGTNRKWWTAASVYLVFLLFIGKPVRTANERRPTGQATATSNTSTGEDETDDDRFQQGYQWAASVMRQAANAPMSRKRAIMSQLSLENNPSLQNKGPSYLRGIGEAMTDLMNEVMEQ